MFKKIAMYWFVQTVQKILPKILSVVIFNKKDKNILFLVEV
jgi:hypothetical protein